MVAASAGAFSGHEGAPCQAVVGEVVSLEQQPAVRGTQLGVGFHVVPLGKKGELNSNDDDWCNYMACKRPGPATEGLVCGFEPGSHCFVWSGTCWSKRCFPVNF